MSCEIGLIGLAVMGQNLALNIAEKGFRIAVYNRTETKTDETLERAKKEGDLPIEGYKSLQEFVQAIRRPRKVVLLVQAGAPVDKVLEGLVPLLETGDVVIDGGNEWYERTEERQERYAKLGLKYMGMGVSGGEEGARHGPALMPGGADKETYELLHPIVGRIAAQVPSGACVSYVGPGGSGHYTKMVHNGIEYGDMQLIAEAYDMLKRIKGYHNNALCDIFGNWNNGVLQSYLIEITARIFAQPDDRDPQGVARLVDKILDVAGSKGTGAWTVQEAIKRGIPCPTIQAAVEMRMMSTLKPQRVEAAQMFEKSPLTELPTTFLDDVHDALYCSKICSYAQGMMLLQKTSMDKGWDLNLAEIARGWEGGCIIRAAFLKRIQAAFSARPDLPSLLVDEGFAKEIKQREAGWRRAVAIAQTSGVAVPAMSGSLTYFDAYSSAELPLNLVQAQRDYFGAHTYYRNDEEGGPFHTNWVTE